MHEDSTYHWKGIISHVRAKHFIPFSPTGVPAERKFLTGMEKTENSEDLPGRIHNRIKIGLPLIWMDSRTLVTTREGKNFSAHEQLNCLRKTQGILC